MDSSAEARHVADVPIADMGRSPTFLMPLDPLSLHFLFNDKAQNQKRYWPNSYPNSQPLCMSFLQNRS